MDEAFTEYEVSMFQQLCQFAMSLLHGERGATRFWDLSAFSHCPKCGWGDSELGARVHEPSLELALETQAALLHEQAADLKEAADKEVMVFWTG